MDDARVAEIARGLSEVENIAGLPRWLIKDSRLTRRPPDQTNKASILRLAAEQGGRCAWCGVLFEKQGWRAPTREHVIPIHTGGGGLAFNSVAACGNCNQARQHLSPDEMRRIANNIDRVIAERGLAVRSHLGEQGDG
jgi:5-methylcytosine-specific restriction endonuclease McrA